ncbi:pentatricopeptide repeat-containing protein At5g57250, mitochondrial-like [Carex rostrata]
MKSPSQIFHRFSSSTSSTSFLTTKFPKPIAKRLTIQNLIKRGVTPSITDLNRYLSFFLRSQRLQLCLTLFSQIISNSITPNPKSYGFLACALLKSCGGSKASENFISYLGNFGIKADDGILNALVVKVCVLDKDPDWAFGLLQEFVDNYELLPSKNTLSTLTSVFCYSCQMDTALKVFEVMSASKIECLNWNYVCSMLISGYSKIGKLELGIRFYERVKKLGLSPNLVTYTALADALCKDGRIEEASYLISEMEEKGIVLDPVLYSTLISGYIRKGLLMDGLMKYCEMIKNGLNPDVVNYTNIIEGFCKEGSVEKVFGFLNEMTRRNISPNLVTLTALIGGFCNRSRFKEALQVYYKIEELGISSDNFAETILIDSMCKNGDLDMAVGFLREMKNKGIKPGTVTYNALINGLCKARRTKEASEVAQGLVADNFTYTTLLHGFLKERDERGIIEIKKRLEISNLSMDIVTCNMLIKALFAIGKVGDACNLFDEMLERNLVADSVTYCTMIDGYCKNGESNKAVDLFKQCRESSPHLSSTCHNFIIRRLIKAGRLDMAVHIFVDLVNELLVPDSSTSFKLFLAQFEENGAEGVLKLVREIENFENGAVLSSICDYGINFLSRKKCPNEALKMYLSLHKRGLRITCKTSNMLLKSLVQNRIEERTTLCFLCECIKLHRIFDITTLNLLSLHSSRSMSQGVISDCLVREAVLKLVKEAKINDACNIVEKVNKNGISIDLSIICTSVIDGLCKAGSIEKALDLCESMSERGICSNVELYNSILNGLCNQGCFVEAFRVLDTLERSDVQLTVYTYTPVIAALCKEGLLKDASKVFDKMLNRGITPDTSVCNLVISGYCNMCLVEDAIKFLSNMDEKYNIQPDKFTINALIKGFSFRGDMEDAFGFFSECKRKGILPTFFGFMHLVDGFYSRGRLEEARGILREMLSCTEIQVLVNKSGGEIYDEPLVSILSDACQQGKIHEVVTILREVGYISNSSSKNSEDLYKLKENNLNNGENLLGKSLFDDFDSYYPTVAALCMKGEVKNASDVINAMILNSG